MIEMILSVNIMMISVIFVSIGMLCTDLALADMVEQCVQLVKYYGIVSWCYTGMGYLHQG